MNVQDRRPGVVAVHSLLHLLEHAHGDIVGIRRQPLGPVRGCLDNQLLLVFRQERVVKKMHVILLLTGETWELFSAQPDARILQIGTLVYHWSTWICPMLDELDSGISAPETAPRKHSFHAPHTE